MAGGFIVHISSKLPCMHYIQTLPENSHLHTTNQINNASGYVNQTLIDSLSIYSMATSLKRLVLNFPGFETTTSVHQIERLTAGGIKTSELWGFELRSAEIEDKPTEHKTLIHFTSSGNSASWQAETRYVHFSWADIIAKYENIPYPKNLLKHLPGYLGFFFDGSVSKYRKASKRYWGFTVYPILLVILFALIAWMGAGWLAPMLGDSAILHFLIATAIFLILCKFPGDRLYVNLSINDWAFARDMCFGSNPEIEERYNLFAEQLLQEVKNSAADEVLIVGHSFGSVWAIMALSKALKKDAHALEGKRITFLAMGSSLLKIGLVKSASFLREATSDVLKMKNLVWHEIQTKTDFVSFYKSDPFKPMGVEVPSERLIVDRVNFKNALSKRRHRKMMKSMYLAHRQYILYCDKPVHHDFQLRVFGPFYADELARNNELALNSSNLTPRVE